MFDGVYRVDVEVDFRLRKLSFKYREKAKIKENKEKTSRRPQSKNIPSYARKLESTNSSLLFSVRLLSAGLNLLFRRCIAFTTDAVNSAR